jgi:hypothetical protein
MSWHIGSAEKVLLRGPCRARRSHCHCPQVARRDRGYQSPAPPIQDRRGSLIRRPWPMRLVRWLFVDGGLSVVLLFGLMATGLLGFVLGIR